MHIKGFLLANCMHIICIMITGRRNFCKMLAATSGAFAFASHIGASDSSIISTEPTINPVLLSKARAAMDRHAPMLARRDIAAITDFSVPSRLPRFFIVDMISGKTEALLVAHGKGSDPEHSGYVQQFSNVPGSEASSSGAYLLSEEYYGQHGASRRLIGLDPENNNALDRAIVIHGAWYVSEDMIAKHGKIGRSQGCFAFTETDIYKVLARLAPGTMLYADKA
jgi:L,D-transpeptidase catalytic domain